MSFVVQEGWIIAKVIHKFKSDYYNVKLEDGEKLSVQSKLPTADYVQSWTLCDPELWQPTYQQQPEQLRTNQKLYNSVQSKDIFMISKVGSRIMIILSFLIICRPNLTSRLSSTTPGSKMSDMGNLDR